MIIAFDIIFQSGEFVNPEDGWWSDLFNTILGAGIGSGVTVWALYRTFKQDKLKEEQRRIEFQKEKVKYFQSLIRGILKDINVQIGHFKTFAESIRQNPVDLPLITMIPLNDLETVVHKLNLEDYYHSYLGEFGDRQEIVDEFRNTISLLNYFEGNFSLMKESLEKSFDFDYERKKQLKELIEKSMDDTASLLAQRKLNEQDTFLNFLNTVIVRFYENQNDQSDLTYFYENFVKVMQHGLLEYSRSNSQAHYLIIQMKRASYIYNEILFQNNNVADDFEGLHTTLRGFSGKLEGFSKRLLSHTVQN